MLVLGALLGIAIGMVLGAGMVAVAGLPAFGPAGAIVAIVQTFGLAGVWAQVISPLIGFLAGGLSLLVVTSFIYAAAAVSLLGVVAPGGAGGPITPPPMELFLRGMLIGLSASVNFMLMSAIPRLNPLAVPLATIALLAVIPGIAANRTVYQPLLGLAGWMLPLNYVMLPLGIVLFVVNLPSALAGGPGAVRFDVRTMSFETTGGTVVGLLFGLAPPATAGFNLGNFTFIRPGVASGAFTGTTLAAHETGHTVTNAAFGGFFGLCNAVDENIAPLMRGPAAYGEMLPESHSSPRGFQSIPMW